MTRTEFEVFKNENLLKRFYWCYAIAERKYLTEKGYNFSDVPTINLINSFGCSIRQTIL
mgnify:CR=1 FL=1|jgi:hypothetical protein|nr:MAG TPA: hypothetical protein [Caudoviricetes sp.]